MDYDIIIAIDPDIEKSGVAELNPKTRALEVANLSFPKLLDYLQFMKKYSGSNHTSLVVIVEAGWLNKSNWHLRSRDNLRAASAKGKATGRNFETGRKIIEMCNHYGIPVIEQKPLNKIWKGKDRKITHDELASFTGITCRTNQDGRDAALLAWVFANLPININK